MRTYEGKSLETTEIMDGQFAIRSLNGDERAFEELFKRYRPGLFKLIFQYLRDYDMACDVSQQVFLQLYISLPTLDIEKPLKNWLFQVARNRCLDELRRKREVRFSELDTYNEEEDNDVLTFVPDSRPLPEDIAEHHEVQAQVIAAIDSLPSRFRSVVFLRYAKQMTFPEIGKVLGMPEATAKTYFSRAKPLLRASLAS
jgi:RNA polymerase sigma factor (sigma-70 family)